MTQLPQDWIQATYENVTYGSNGVEFTFTQRYDAPFIWTNFYVFFGTVEVVMQAAPGTGVISSAVLLSDDGDEIDWEFSGNNFGSSTGLVQTNYFGKGITGDYDRGTQPQVNSPPTMFHTYTLNWTPTSLTWAVDGTIVRTLLAADADNGSHQYPQSPCRLHLGLWDAGDPSSAEGVIQWAGGVTDLTGGPYTAYVKSVRITNAYPCANYVYTDESGSMQSIGCLNSNNQTMPLYSTAPATHSSATMSTGMAKTGVVPSTTCHPSTASITTKAFTFPPTPTGPSHISCDGDNRPTPSAPAGAQHPGLPWASTPPPSPQYRGGGGDSWRPLGPWGGFFVPKFPTSILDKISSKLMPPKSPCPSPSHFPSQPHLVTVTAAAAAGPHIAPTANAEPAGNGLTPPNRPDDNRAH